MGPIEWDYSDKQGSIYVYTYASRQSTPMRLSVSNPPAVFHPLGIAILPAKDNTDTGKLRIFVANQVPRIYGGPSVEVFDLDSDGEDGRPIPKSMKHIGSVKHPEIRTPNSIVALGPQTVRHSLIVGKVPLPCRLTRVKFHPSSTLQMIIWPYIQAGSKQWKLCWALVEEA